MSERAARFLDSTVQMVRNVPHLALIPLVILWFGIDEEAKIFLVSFGVFFPIYVNTFHGVRTVDPGLIEMGRVYGLDRRALFAQVIFPGALPSILVGVRYALGFTWLTLIVAETISASAGIGYMTMNAREFLQTDVVVLGILIYALLGKAADIVTGGARALLSCLAPCISKGTRMSAAGQILAFPREHIHVEDPAVPGNAPNVIMHPAQRGVPVHIAHIAKIFGEKSVLTDVSLDIHPGEFVAIVGHSGLRQKYASASCGRPRYTQRWRNQDCRSTRCRAGRCGADHVSGCTAAAVAQSSRQCRDWPYRRSGAR